MNSLNTLKYDLISIISYCLLVTFGIINIHSSSFNESFTSIFDSSTIVGKQIIFLIISSVTFVIIIFTKNNVFDRISPLLYFASIILLLSLFIFGVERGGAKSWYLIGPISFQPTELAKLSTALFLAKFLSIIQTDLNKTRDILIVGVIILIPIILITFQPDPGSALVFLAFIFPVLREGLDLRFFYFGLIIISTLILTLILGVSKSITTLSILFLILYIYNRRKKFKTSILRYLLSFIILVGVSFSTNYLFENILEQRHRDRINLIIGKEVDDRGIGYNTNQSKIAISNGGLFGAGFLQGTQTKGNFVPRQHTDYIFSTIGEEWGFIGSLITILFFMLLIIRISLRADRQVNHFKRIYCHCFASLLFFHFFVNVGMSIGLVPSIGIPLPFISYGGSSLLMFSVMFFIYLNFDSSRLKED
ncbi:MAG: rod shape-determining protein RodA [Cryomorphaceae bacterium]|jgi:rod shape determining protein RodA|nr:rod shape-determining protein RodA [Cryomorphaceae bacterium]MBT7738975.1 rod shape-determining protein RodA [Cryomorphaceae bacterium]